MPIYKHPKSGRTQEVQERETVRIATLERLGWKLVENVLVTEQTLTPEKLGDPVLKVTETPTDDAPSDDDVKNRKRK